MVRPPIDDLKLTRIHAGFRELDRDRMTIWKRILERFYRHSSGQRRKRFDACEAGYRSEEAATIHENLHDLQRRAFPVVSIKLFFHDTVALVQREIGIPEHNYVVGFDEDETNALVPFRLEVIECSFRVYWFSH